MKNLVSILASLSLLLLFSCEENTGLVSEKKIKKEIQGTWNRAFLTVDSVQTVEHWVLADGKISIYLGDKYHNPELTDEGYYSVDAKLSGIFLKLSQLEENVPAQAQQKLNAKWNIVELHDGILYIATDEGTGGVRDREFIKLN
jgi:hypothetical protein